jgi:hypothetical protein
MADVEFTTNPRVSSADFLHASERAPTLNLTEERREILLA